MNTILQQLLPHGFKDWRTTVPIMIFAFFVFVSDYPQHFPPVLVDFAGWVKAAAIAYFGANVSSAFMVKKKTPEDTDAHLIRRGQITPSDVAADPVSQKQLQQLSENPPVQPPPAA